MASSNSKVRVATLIQVIEGLLIFFIGLMLVIKKNANVLNYVIGIVFLAIGIAMIIVDIVRHKRVVTQNTLQNVGFISLGLLAVVDTAIPIATFVKWFALVLGSVLIVDMVLVLAFKNKDLLVIAIIEGVLGVVLLVFAILFLVGVDGINTAFYIVSGIILMLYGVLIITLAILRETKNKG